LVQKIWDDLPRRFETVVLDAFQIMPNHLHAVLALPGPGLDPALAVATGAPIIQPGARVGVGLAPRSCDRGNHRKQGTASGPPTGRRIGMGDVVGSFKSISTIAVNRLMSRPGRRLLQTNFYEHIVRNLKELEMIRDYVVHNPQRWLEDPDNPDVVARSPRPPKSRGWWCPKKGTASGPPTSDVGVGLALPLAAARHSDGSVTKQKQGTASRPDTGLVGAGLAPPSHAATDSGGLIAQQGTASGPPTRRNRKTQNRARQAVPIRHW